jgi:hypothetical protein
MGAPSSTIANNPTVSGGNVTPSSGGKGNGSGKSGMSSIQPSNQTLTSNTAQPAMGAPAAYSNTITPNQSISNAALNQSTSQSGGQLLGSVLSGIGQNSMNSGKTGNSGIGSVMNKTGQGFQSHGKGQ